MNAESPAPASALQRPGGASSIDPHQVPLGQTSWLDPQPLDASWPRPSGRSRVPRWVRIVIPICLLAILGGGLWAGGGFRTARQPWVTVDPGTIQSAGPLDVIWTHAVARPFTDDKYWMITVYGRCRATGSEKYLALVGDAAFLIADHGGAVLGNGTLLDFETVESSLSDRNYLTPGIGWVPCSITTENHLPWSYQPTSQTWVGVANVQYSDVTVTKSGDKSWNPTSGGTRVIVPMTVRPQ